MTFVLPVVEKPGTFIAMFDLWNPKNQISSRYVWIPVTFAGDTPEVVWRDEFSY